MDDMKMGGEMDGGMDRGAPPPLPAGGPPPDAGAMSPEGIRAKVEAALPTPDEGYSVKKIGKLADATNAAMGALLKDQGLPDVVVPPNPGKGDRWLAKLPSEIMVPVLLLADLAVTVGGEAGARYAVDPASLVDDDALALVTATMRALASDKKIARAVSEASSGAPAKDAEKPAEKAPTGPPKEAAQYM